MQANNFFVQVFLCSLIVVKLLVLREQEKTCAAVHSRQACDVLLSFDGFEPIFVVDQGYILDRASFENDDVSQFLSQMAVLFLSFSIRNTSLNSFEEVVSRKSGVDIDKNNRGDDGVEHMNP
jgi:hypothetical protein